MKYLIVLLIVFGFFFCSCDAPADNDPKMVRGALNPNPEADMSHYEIYWWQGNSGFTPDMLQLIETVPHSFIADSIVSNSFQLVLDYVVFGAIAVDSTNYKSEMAYTRVYSYIEFFAPSTPDSLRINQ